VTPEDFQFGMLRLEQMFNRGVEIGHNIRMEYFEALKYVDTRVFQEAVVFVIGSFKPYPSETFPSLAVLESAIIDMREESAEAAAREARRTAPDTFRNDFCQRCSNLGLYLGDDGQAHFCVCEEGRVKRASWDIPSGVRKRDEKVQKALEKLPPSHGSVRGLHEWNPLGFWELNVMEHERWMAAKRTEVEEIKCREAARPEKIPSPSDELRFKDIKDTIARIKFRERMVEPAEKEPVEDEEDDEEVGF